MSLETLMQSYMVAYVFWLCMSLGCFGLMLLHHVVRGRWGLIVLRPLEAGAKTLPLMAVGFLPIVLGMRSLYWWTSPGRYAHEKILQGKLWYLNTPAWLTRGVLFFLLWIGLTAVLTRWTADEDRTGNPDFGQKRSNVSAPGLVMYALTVTFAFTDWVMSIEPYWTSTIFGVWFAINQCLAAMSFVVLVALVGARKKPLAGLITPAVTRDLGNMLLTLTMMWGYLTLSQYLIIWSANLPEEARYFVSRLQGGWNWVGAALAVGQFFIPFLLLLSTALKRSVKMLGFVCAWILAMRVVGIVWTVAPAFPDQASHSVVLDLVLMAAMGVVWLGWFAAMRRRSAPLPTYDPRLMETASHA